MVSSTTVSKVGVRDVPPKTSNHEKICASVCIAMKGDSTNLKLFIAFAGAKWGAKELDEELKKHYGLLPVQMVGWTNNWPCNMLIKFLEGLNLVGDWWYGTPLNGTYK